MIRSSSTRSIQVLMPMGGLGARFRSKGIIMPKPLIDIDGKPMFARSFSSLAPLSPTKAPIVVVRKDDDNRHEMTATIEKELTGARIVRLSENTRGPVESCLAARHLLQDDHSLLVLDSDVYFKSRSYVTAVSNAARLESKTDGVLLYHHSTDPRFGFLELDGHGFVKRTAEKVVISDKAIVGAYFFSKAKAFIEAAERVMAGPTGPRGEYYLSQIYNALIEHDQAKVLATPADLYLSFGTPEELAVSLPLFRSLLQTPNHE